MTVIDPTCGRSYPPNPNQRCVRVVGHAGRHVWLNDDSDLHSMTTSWRDHAADCGCAYCRPLKASSS